MEVYLSATALAYSLYLQGWGLIDLLLRVSNEGLPRPRVARAKETSRPSLLSYTGQGARTLRLIDVRTRFRARIYSQPVMASAEIHIQRHQESDALLSLPSQLGGGWDDPNCARRTSTFLSCAFREQRDRPSYPLLTF